MFFFLNLSTVLSDLTPENLANIWQINWNRTRSMNSETVVSDVFRLVVIQKFCYLLQRYVRLLLSVLHTPRSVWKNGYSCLIAMLFAVCDLLIATSFRFLFLETRHSYTNEASSRCSENRKCQTSTKVWTSWKRTVTQRLWAKKRAGIYRKARSEFTTPQRFWHFSQVSMGSQSKSMIKPRLFRACEWFYYELLWNYTLKSPNWLVLIKENPSKAWKLVEHLSKPGSVTVRT